MMTGPPFISCSAFAYSRKQRLRLDAWPVPFRRGYPAATGFVGAAVRRKMTGGRVRTEGFDVRWSDGPRVQGLERTDQLRLRP